MGNCLSVPNHRTGNRHDFEHSPLRAFTRGQSLTTARHTPRDTTTTIPTTSGRRSPVKSSNSFPSPQYTVFISHAGEDKATIAIPLRQKLQEQNITAFVDEADMPPGTDAKDAMIHAMRTATIAVIVLSPEFIAKKWPMKELMYFLGCREESIASYHQAPTIIPLFYRLSVQELYDEPRLDRTDEHGNLLYEVSRFYERQRNGDPEANIAAIKNALKTVHGIMGVRNFVDATNNSSYEMSARREVILENLVNEICRCMSRRIGRTDGSTPATVPKIDSFEPYFDTQYDVSDLIFDFESRENSGSFRTQEGKVLEMLLDTSAHEKRVIAVRGIGGVGKTSLLRGISSLQVVKDRFRDGIYYFSLGMDAKLGNVLEELNTAVSRSGGKQIAENTRAETSARKTFATFRAWFANKQCLFVCDDVWETLEVSAGIIYDLLRLHVSGSYSKTLLSTRSFEVAARAGSCFVFEPRRTLELESRAILFHYSGLIPEEGDEQGGEAVEEILKLCGGLPLFLAIAGRAVKTLSFRYRHIGCLTFHVYAEKLKEGMNSLITTAFDSYAGLAARLRVSIVLLEKRRAMFGFEAKLSVAEMHRRLSVMKKQERVPMKMLKQLWELKDESQAASMAKEFEQVGLADVEFCIKDSYPMEKLSLHDSVYEFAAYETRVCEEERLGHEKLLQGYGTNLMRSAGIREWWSTMLDTDDYIHRNICRHLVKAGRKEELFQLLLMPEWTERQVTINGIFALEADFALGLKTIQDEMAPVDNEDIGVTEEALRLIGETLSLSLGFVLRNKRELWFQVHGRLKRAGESNRLIRPYLRWIEKNAGRPQLICVNRFLVEPCGANTRIVSVGGGVSCMVWLQKGERIACGCSDGRILLVNTRRSEIERCWKAHKRVISTISIDRAATRIVSGSYDSTAKVWIVETGDCPVTFNPVLPGDGRGFLVNVDTATVGQREAYSICTGTMQAWDINTGRTIGASMDLGAVDCMAVFRDGERILTGEKDGKLRIWDTRTGGQVGTSFKGHTMNVNCVALTADERILVSGSLDRTIRRWDVESHRQSGKPLRGHTASVLCVTLSMDGRRIVSGSEDMTIRIWDIDSGEEICEALTGHTHGVSGVLLLEDTDSIISCSFDGTIRVWDWHRKRNERLQNRHEDIVSGVSFTPDGKFVVSASFDRTIRIWDAVTGKQVGKPLSGHTGCIFGMTVTSDGESIISVSWDKTVRIWDFESRVQIGVFTSPLSLDCVAVFPSDDMLVTGSYDGTIRIWDLTEMDGRHVVFEGHNEGVCRVFVSDDGSRVVSVDWESNVSVWDVVTGKIIKNVMKDGIQLMSRTQIFDVVGEVTIHDEAGLSVPHFKNEITYSDGSESVVLGTLESKVRCWDLSPDKTKVCVGLQDGLVGLAKL